MGKLQATSYKPEAAGSKLRFLLVGLRLVACSSEPSAAKARKAAFLTFDSSHAAMGPPVLQIKIQDSNPRDPACPRLLPPPAIKKNKNMCSAGSPPFRPTWRRAGSPAGCPTLRPGFGAVGGMFAWPTGPYLREICVNPSPQPIRIPGKTE